MENKIKFTINNILLSNTIKEKQNLIIKYIPEIQNMIGFDHKHPHHNLDVWEHTLKVLDNLNYSNDLELKMAALLHDIGKPFSYQDDEVRHFHGHPKISKKISLEILTRLNYSNDFITNVNYLILNHDTPINPDIMNNTYLMTKKLLELQYADAKAHHPDKIEKRIIFLNEIKKQLELKNKYYNEEKLI